jgi:MOSC domain-containing protein YiiM
VSLTGRVVSLFIAKEAGAAMISLSEVRAVPGRGLEGDRYFYGQGTWFQPNKPNREVTLIELEALEGVRREYALEIHPSETRRNILTQGVPLNHLVGREFRIGEARLRGLKLCEPCDYLEKLVGKKVCLPLLHRGGLRAQILDPGMIRVGDTIEAAEPQRVASALLSKPIIAGGS